MEITINNNWTIEADNYGWIVRRYEISNKLKPDGNKPRSYGQPTMREKVFPANIKAAVKHIAEHEARVTMPNLAAFEERIDRLEENITRLIKDHKL